MEKENERKNNNAGTLDLSKMTKLFPVTKSIQLELIPTEQTKRTIEDLKFEEYDKHIQDLAEELYPWIDCEIKNIANLALKRVDFDFSSLVKYEDENNNKRVEKEKSVLLKQIIKHVNDVCVECYGLKKAKDLNSKAFIQTVLEKGGEEAADLLKRMKGKTEAVRPFLVSRVTALEVRMPERVLENFEKYMHNTSAIEKILGSSLGNEVKNSFPESAYYVDAKGYSDCLTQDGIGRYNAMINGTVTNEGVETKGLIMLVNEHNHVKTNSPLPAPKKLFKQILIPSEKAFTIQTVESDDDLKELLREANSFVDPAAKEISSAINAAFPADVVVKFNKLHVASNYAYGDHRKIPDAVIDGRLRELLDLLEDASSEKERRKYEKMINKEEEKIKKECFTFKDIEDALDDPEIFDNFKKNMNIAASFAVETSKHLMQSLGVMKDIRENADHAVAIKEFFDAWTEYRNAVACVLRNDADFGSHLVYNIVEDEWLVLKQAAEAEVKAMAYITRKPADIVKKSITWLGNASTGATEWLHEEGKISARYSTIVKRDGKYYYFMLAPGAKPVDISGNGPDQYFTQYALKNMSANLPRYTFSNSAKNHFEENPDESYFITENMKLPVEIDSELYRIYNEKLYTKSAVEQGVVTEAEYRKNLVRILKSYMDYLNSSTLFDKLSVAVKDLSEYKDSSEFFADVECTCSKEWHSASVKKIDELVEKGLALMFLISAKDLYMTKQNKNAYSTIFLTALRDASSGVSLLSNPKVFTRKAAIKNPTVHKAGSILVNRHDADGKRIPEKVYLEIFNYYNSKTAELTDLSEEAMNYIESGRVVKRKADYAIIKDRRYTEDKYIIAFAIKKNSEVPKKNRLGLNDMIDSVSSNKITLTRSAHDLIYYTVTDQKETVLESRSLNEISGLNYWERLRDLSETRKQEKSEKWKYDREMKDFRNAYITAAITEIVKKVIEYNAIVICERLNDDIKNKYDALDNTVFKSFENRLTERLSDLYFTDIELGKPGSVTNPYQLCGDGNDFQNGIVFFVSPSYTATVDTETGFVNLFDFRNIRTVTDRRFFLSKFESIDYDPAKNRFVFNFDYDNFVTKKNMKDKCWNIVAGGATVRYNREKKYNEYIAEEASSIKKILFKDHSADDDFAKLAFKGLLKTEETNALYDVFVNAVRSVVNAHDEARKKYVSPVTGKEEDYAEHATLALEKKFMWLMSERDAKDEWIDHIKNVA